MNAQLATSTFLFSHGSALLFAGVLWPFTMILSLVPHPRLALTAHIQFMFRGLLSLLLALLLLPRLSLLSLSPTQCSLVKFAAAWDWVVVGSEMVNAWWGTAEAMPIAAKEAGVVQGRAGKWKEGVVLAAHVGSMGTVGMLGVVCWEFNKGLVGW